MNKLKLMKKIEQNFLQIENNITKTGEKFYGKF